MTLSPAEVEALRRLLCRLLPEEEALIVLARHRRSPPPGWEEIGLQLSIHPLRADRLYRKGLRALREQGRLLSGLLLEAPAQDR